MCLEPSGPNRIEKTRGSEDMKRVLVIDDEQLILEAFREILQPSASSNGLDEISALTAELESESLSDNSCRFPSFYEVVCARQGEEGYRLITESVRTGDPFHVAFIDVRMPPGWDGIKTAREIRAVDPYIEIVIVTAYSDRNHSEIASSIGMPEKLLYLRKPFDREEIKQIALSLTRKWELEYKHRKHLEYLEKLLNSVRRLKTLGISSVKDVLLAILNELLIIVNADKGLVFNIDNGHPEIEIISGTMSQDTVEELTRTVINQAKGIHEITSLGDILFFPLKNEAGTYLILVFSQLPVVDEEKLNLLKLFIETASEVLLSVNQQEQFLKSEKIATIGQVAAGIIHEISNPLSSLVTLIQPKGLMKKKLDCIETDVGNNRKLVSDIVRYLDIAAMATTHIASIVTSMRGMTGATRIMFQRRDVREAIEDALILANNTLRKKCITIHKDINSPLIANCDMNGLKQVFLNLILNAAQAIDKHGDIWIAGVEEENRIQISVRDNGPGIPGEMADMIFKLFYTTKEEGTGLGLSIVKGIVENHQGSIRIQSEPGKGATFYVDIAAS